MGSTSIFALTTGFFAFANPAFAQRKIITTLLPERAQSRLTRGGDMLKISANGSDPIRTTSTVDLRFDLRGIPREAAITRVTLRLVGREIEPNPQLVRVFDDPRKDSIGQWTAIPGRSVFSTATDSFRQAVAEAVRTRGGIKLTLTSTSRLSDWNYYGLSDTAFASSFKPRLIVEYDLPATPEGPLSSQTTTRTSRRFWSPSEVKVKPFHNNITFVSNPMFYRGDIYAFGKPTSEKTFFYDFAPGGVERWRAPIKLAPGSHALVTETGLLYSVGENRIVLYDLARHGAVINKTVDVPDLHVSVPPALGVDGSLYFVRSGYGYVYGLNPELEALWRYLSEEGAGAATFSRITLSPEAGQYAYTLFRRKKMNSLALINATDGSAQLVAIGNTFEDFHRPLAVRGPKQDYIIVSAYSQGGGIVSVYSGGALRLEKPGTVSQPIVDRGGKRVFVVQGGRLHAYDVLNRRAACTSAESDLARTSNPVLDGDQNLYVWNNGELDVFRSNDCQRFFHQQLPVLPESLDLLFAQDGTLYARTRTQHLFSLTPPATGSWG